MPTLESQLQTANLSNNCKVDLMNHAEQIELRDATLPKKPVTAVDSQLPAGVTVGTSKSSSRRAEHASTGSGARYATQKQAQAESMASVSMVAQESGKPYFKPYQTRYDGCPSNKDPFRESRSRQELSGRDQDFVYRYAEAVSGGPVERPAPADDASATATEAYKTAFRSYKGREPTAKELQEVGRLEFGFTENGDVGVVQKPHSCYPHSHVSCSHRRVPECSNQVYAAEVPGVRAARDRFPGPVPASTYTKNLTHATAGDMYAPGHQETRSLKLKSAADTMTGSM